MQGTKKIVTNTAYLYIRLIFVLLISLFTVRIVLGALGEIDYGIYNVVCGFVSMFGFLNTSMTNGVQRFYNYSLGKNEGESIGMVFTTSLYIQAALAVTLIVLVESIGLWYVNNVMVLPAEKLSVANFLFQFSLIGLLLSFLQIPYSAAVVAYEKMNYYAFVGIVDAVAKLGIAYAITITPERLFYYGLFLLCVNIVNFLLFFYYAHHNFKNLRLIGRANKKLAKKMLSFTGWNTFGSFAYIVRWQGVNVLMNAFFGVIVNAANGIASQVSSALAYFSGNLILAFKPQLTQSYAAMDYKRTQYLWFLMTKVSYALVLTLSIPIMLEIDYILNIWLGGNVPDYTTTFSVLVIITVILGCFHSPIVQIIHATGEMRNFQIVTSGIIISILPLSWLCFVMGLNPNWAYWITIMVYIVNQLAGMIMVKRYFDYSYSLYVKDVVLRCALFTIITPITAIILELLMQPSFMKLIAICLTTALIASGSVYFIILDKNEKKSITNIIKKIYLGLWF